MHKHHNKIAYLDNPQRNGGLTAEALLDQLAIKKSDHILDFGAGTGYFTLPLAQKVDETVFALDTDPAMLALIREKAQAAAIENIELLSGELTDGALAEESLDVILASLVLHEITPLGPVLDNMHSLLKAGGQLIAIELEPKTGGPKAPRLTSSGLEQQLMEAGFKVAEKFFPAPSLYVLVARK
ncbi:class I SAM-dependent methyltransferase [Planococcus maritimus]|nr:class I SAM-dependent methyltransferase [Planococcus sp. SK3692]MDE4085341.1 class I SAM-dependent methyltransferase [Planococcus maritimus]